MDFLIIGLMLAYTWGLISYVAVGRIHLMETLFVAFFWWWILAHAVFIYLVPRKK